MRGLSGNYNMNTKVLPKIKLILKETFWVINKKSLEIVDSKN